MLWKKYDYHLPEQSIAKFPVTPRDHCRLLHCSLEKNAFSDYYFFNLPDLLQKNDLLVVNDSGVQARRVYLTRDGVDEFEVVFLHTEKKAMQRFEAIKKILGKEKSNAELWRVLIRKSKKLKTADQLTCPKDKHARFYFFRDDISNETFLLSLHTMDTSFFMKIGEMPIPPYMRRKAQESDSKDYQNYFAHSFASAAAPTAALHFTDDVYDALRKKGVMIETVTLDIGYGTFAPLSEANFRTNSLHPEHYKLSPKLASILKTKNYNRLISLGTTSLRVLETVALLTNNQFDKHLEGDTTLFLHPPSKLKITDGLITNFHVPESSLMMLVASLLGREVLLQAYNYAIKNDYRFLSYGDAMLIL